MAVVRLGLAQVGFPADGDVLAQVRTCSEAAQEEGVDLLVFPEALTVPEDAAPNVLRSSAETLEGDFVKGLCQTADNCGIWIVATLFEQNADRSPCNTAVIVSSSGELCGSYRKCHLYDAHGTLESARMSAGDALFTPVETPFGKLGLGICYDLRFPEVVRSAVLQGCELFCLPAAWHDGPRKAGHWETLLRARAIENELFMAGACRAGKRYVERSMVVDPLGERVVAQETAVPGGELLCCDIDPAKVRAARNAMPVLEHRRPSLYA